MPKDTKNLGYIKALACESRGFVIKKEGVPIFDTPSFFVFWQEIFPLSVKLHEQMRLFDHKCVFLHYYTHLTHRKQTEKEALVAERQVQI